MLRILEQAISKRFRVGLKFSKHAVDRFSTRGIKLEELAGCMSRLLRDKLCVVLYHLNIGDRVLLVLSKNLSVAIVGSGTNITVTTVIDGSHSKYSVVIK